MSDDHAGPFHGYGHQKFALMNHNLDQLFGDRVSPLPAYYIAGCGPDCTVDPVPLLPVTTVVHFDWNDDGDRVCVKCGRLTPWGE